ncbi:MAG TPA: molybdopterin-dependent oxidoreductase [Devosiaceae bacterium]|jgi:hypothetical protein
MYRHTAIALFSALLVLAPLGASAQSAPAKLKGEVTTPLTLDQSVLGALPKTTIDLSFETSKGKESGTYTGVLLWDLLGKAGLVNAPGNNTALRHTVMITGSDDYVVAVALGELDPKFANKQVVLAYQSSDPSVSFDHLRVVVPGDLHGGRAVKDVVSIEVK